MILHHMIVKDEHVPYVKNNIDFSYDHLSNDTTSLSFNSNINF